MRDADKAFLGVDIGTSSIAAVVTDADGKVLKTLTVANPSAGWARLDGGGGEILQYVAARAGGLLRLETCEAE